MSNKSRQDKTKTPAQATAPPPASNDIIPGRFTEAEWHHMVEQEDGEEFVVEIVNEIVESTMKVLHDQYIVSQTLPYTIQETKNLLLQIIEWQFLACDTGENNPACDSTWLEEEEPVTAVTDSWAQGSVPIMLRPSSASSTSSVQSDRESELSSVVEDRPGAPEPPFEALEASATPLSINSPAQLPPPTSVERKEEHQEEPAHTKKIQNKKRTSVPFKPHKGKLPSFSGVDLTPLTDDYVLKKQEEQEDEARHYHSDTNGLKMLSSSSSILKSSRLERFQWSSVNSSTPSSWSTSYFSSSSQAQYGRPPGIKDVLYDDRGNVVAVMKISPEKLPSHRVRTKFAVVDDDFDGQSGRTRVRTKKLGPSSQKADHGKEWKPSKSEIRRQNFDTSTVNNNSYQIEGTGQITPLPPPLVDAMDISAGVLVREGKIIRRGPRQVPRRVEKTPSTACLQPLDSTRPSGRVISELLTRSSPVIRPLRMTEPIPPITSQPQTYT